MLGVSRLSIAGYSFWVLRLTNCGPIALLARLRGCLYRLATGTSQVLQILVNLVTIQIKVILEETLDRLGVAIAVLLDSARRSDFVFHDSIRSQ